MMNDIQILPELKQIVGAMLFAAKKPLTAADVLRVLKQVADSDGGAASDFAHLAVTDIQRALDDFREELKGLRLGFNIHLVANGFRMENDVECGPWLRQLLEKGRVQRLSRPALETLAIIAYRQPCTRSEVEQVRGVAVDQIVRNLIEMQLIRVAGRSELPGRPWQFGTTQRFLEHFGLRSLEEMPGVEELRKLAELKPMKPSADAELAGEQDSQLQFSISEAGQMCEDGEGDE